MERLFLMFLDHTRRGTTVGRTPLDEIMFCLGLSYVKRGAILGHKNHILSMKTKCQVTLFQSINPFSSSAFNISIYHILMIMPPVLHIFAPYSPCHNLQQFKYSIFS